MLAIRMADMVPSGLAVLARRSKMMRNPMSIPCAHRPALLAGEECGSVAKKITPKSTLPSIRCEESGRSGAPKPARPSKPRPRAMPIGTESRMRHGIHPSATSPRAHSRQTTPDDAPIAPPCDNNHNSFNGTMVSYARCNHSDVVPNDCGQVRARKTWERTAGWTTLR